MKTPDKPIGEIDIDIKDVAALLTEISRLRDVVHRASELSGNDDVRDMLNSRMYPPTKIRRDHLRLMERKMDDQPNRLGNRP